MTAPEDRSSKSRSSAGKQKQSARKPTPLGIDPVLSLPSEQGDWCIGYLRRQIEELRADDITYESEKALTLLGQVIAEQERFEQFEGLAREMAAREWERIIRLADRAVKKRKRALASQVFEAALTSGSHMDFLRKKYEQLKEGKWNPDPRK